MLKDSKARQEAMVLESKLIKAPAGSGKTALLTNYFLKLLGVVEHPREIQALTFTNKAAQEMKNRIVDSILRVNSGFKPSNEYEKENYRLATEALRNSKAKGWHVEKNSNMLNISTIDSFCKRVLVDHVGTGQLATRNVAQDPKLLYQKAVTETLSLYSDAKYGAPIQKLLAHFGNKVSKVEKLLVEMIETRERWIPVLFVDKQAARVQLEEKRGVFLETIVDSNYHSLQAKESQLLSVLSKLELKDSCLVEFVNDGFKGGVENNKAIFSSLNKLLCTTTKKAKVRFTKNDGISPDLNKNDKDEIVSELKELSEQCVGDLIVLSDMPDSKYKESEWVLLSSAFEVMPLILAKLNLIFREFGEVDFTEIALNAVRALDSESGEETSSAITKSQTINHILVDEFQDSNNTQLLMIRLLIDTWSSEDKNTLFLVGDAMQSLYGFRGADVNVFMDAENGIGNVDIKTLSLTTNFRSTAGIVEWVNNIFSQAFPKENDLLLSASKYSNSTAVKLSSAFEEPVELHGFTADLDGKQEAKFIAEQIKNIQDNEPTASIAVLGRTRSSLKPILEHLANEADISATAVNLNRIDKEPLCIVAIALARLLIDDMDKLAWLTILNSGLFGLSHNTIEAIFNFDSDPYLAVNDDRVAHLLTSTELSRYSYALNQINMAIEGKHNKDLDLLLEGIWYNLHGPSLAEKEIDLTNVSLVFSLFENVQSTDLSLKWLERHLETLYAESSQQISGNTRNVELMTIHKSKGLEFDYVFIPSMHKRGLISSSKLFSWGCTGELGDLGVMACSEELGIKSKSVSYHAFLGKLKANRELEELKRVVYVGVTRAIKKAYLCGKVEVNNDTEVKPPAKGSMFEVIEPAFQSELVVHESEHVANESAEFTPTRTIIDANLQLTLPKRDTLAAYRGDANVVPNPNGVVWQKPVSRIEGVVIHRVIEQICSDGLELWNEDKVNSYSSVILASLKELSLEQSLLITSVRNVKEEVNRILQCNVFRELCKKHKLDNLELSMSVRKNRQIQTLIIDKGFVTEDGVAHIIDWKSAGVGTDQSMENFINSQVTKHKEKLKLYSDAYKQVTGAISVESALYFTKTNQLERCL